MHVTAFICVRLFFDLLARESRCMPHLEGCTLRVMDLGSMDMNGSVKTALAKARHFNEKFRWSYTGVDAEAGPNGDV